MDIEIKQFRSQYKKFLCRIWAADMASIGGGGGPSSHQYEMVNKNKHYDTIRSVRSQSRMSGKI